MANGMLMAHGAKGFSWVISRHEEKDFGGQEVRSAFQEAREVYLQGTRARTRVASVEESNETTNDIRLAAKFLLFRTSF